VIHRLVRRRAPCSFRQIRVPRPADPPRGLPATDKRPPASFTFYLDVDVDAVFERVEHRRKIRQRADGLDVAFGRIDAIRQLLEEIDVPERSLKRRFKAATGSTLIEYLQNLRIEEAKRLLEQGELPIDEVSEAVGYLDISFFRRLFKRLTGLTPSQYRRMFQPLQLSRG